MEGKRYPSQRADSFIVRFDKAGMRDHLKQTAAANRRSMNAEINARLEASFEAEKENAQPAATGQAFVQQ
ncbi:Arc family DNA-binding protein [Burkholderia glumae]|uniref:Arc family DNA-binding protein n=1 Tax=Burkholderia glumae TaxID=337 RepID=UPI00215079BC|nr:Arc family DNA-binding protein [Burkholderia glumae]